MQALALPLKGGDEPTLEFGFRGDCGALVFGPAFGR